MWSLEDQSYSKSLFISFCRNVWITQPNLAPKLTWHLLQIYFLRSKFLPEGRELFYTPKSWILSFLESLSKIKTVIAVSWFVCVLLPQQILERSKKSDPKTSCLQKILRGLSLDIKIFPPRWVMIDDTKRSWILYSQGSVNLMLSESACNMCFIISLSF